MLTYSPTELKIKIEAEVGGGDSLVPSWSTSYSRIPMLVLFDLTFLITVGPCGPFQTPVLIAYAPLEHHVRAAFF